MAASDARALSKEEKKAQKEARRAQGREQRGQMWQVFKMQAKEDKVLVPAIVGIVLGSALLCFLIGLLWGGQWWMLFLGLMLGILLAMIFFTRRVQASVYKKADGTPGAAAWALDQLRSGWRVTPSVAMNTHLDAVHRVVGRPGVVLVGEGEPHRLRPLMNQEKKKLSRVIGDTPIYELIVGEDTESKPEQVPLSKLNRRLTRYPMNITKDKIDAVDSRLKSLNNKMGMQNQMPKGPVPQGAKVRNLNRTARRRGGK